MEGRIAEGLAHVLILKVWIFAAPFGRIGIEGGNLDDPPDRQTEPPKTGLAVHPRGIDKDPVERAHGEA